MTPVPTLIATYNTVQDHVSLLDHLTSEQRALKDRIASLESVLTNLKAGYNPNYQDMAVLEAVRGWDALKPAEKEEIEDADQVEGESNDSDSVPEEPKWTESRINELKRTDPLSILLEHERHINGGVDDEVTKLCEPTSISFRFTLAYFKPTRSILIGSIHPRWPLAHLRVSSGYCYRYFSQVWPAWAHIGSSWRLVPSASHRKTNIWELNARNLTQEAIRMPRNKLMRLPNPKSETFQTNLGTTPLL